MYPKQLELDVNVPCDYNVYINGVLKGSVNTEKAAWDIIGQARFGSLYHVRDKNNQVRAEFVPF
jgi:hypothetical protein